MDSHRLKALLGFINEEMLFPSVLHNFKFCLFILGGGQNTHEQATIVFNSYNIEQCNNNARRFSLTSKDIELLNPNTRTCPVFFWRASADITKAIYKRIPILHREGSVNEWGVKFGTMFHMSNDSKMFTIEPNIDHSTVPLYEAKMFDQYNHRYASYEHLKPGERSHMLPEVPIHLLGNPNYRPRSCYFIEKSKVKAVLNEVWSADWLLGFREITSAGLWRTTIYSILPRCGTSNKIPLVFFDSSCTKLATSFLSCMNSFVLDFISRQKLGGSSYSFFIKRQLTIPSPSTFNAIAPWDNSNTMDQWVRPRVLELTYTAWDLEAFAKDCGYDGPPFKWDEERRFLMRCELDAAYFHLYEIERDDVDYIMETFPIVKRKDIAAHGEYRTKRVILEIYDEMQKAIETGEPYQTRLDPPPADPRVAHPADSRREA